MKFDEYEKEILEAEQKGQLKRKRPSKKELTAYQKAARNTLSKNRRVNIRISESDLRELQIQALHEGIPYQTFMTSILHKFISGSLVPAYAGRQSRSTKRNPPR
jgi:predicted DNA binding CopG/RHH family protein